MLELIWCLRGSERMLHSQKMNRKMFLMGTARK
jgi:hypothetical protein